MAAPPPPTHTDPAVLIDDLVEEFLLRLPPEDPAALARAALVNRQWHRVITGPIFRRRFRELHRSPPLLGYFANTRDSIRFVPMSSFRPRDADLRYVQAIHSSHGRVLLLLEDCTRKKHVDVELSVWHPITGEQRELPVVPCPHNVCFWDAALVCAGGDGCNHLHCHYKVFFVGTSQGRMRSFSCFYSSEANSWSDPIFISKEGYKCLITGGSALVGSALYFWCIERDEILKYDMLTHQMCTIVSVESGGVLIATEDGKVGVANTWNSKLRLLSLREHDGRWEESRVIELHTLLPDDTLWEIEAFCNNGHFVVGFAEIGAGVIFLSTQAGYFTIDLNSGRSKKVGDMLVPVSGIVVPYVSFCTPASGAVSTDEGSGAGVAVSTDEARSWYCGLYR